MSRRAGYGLAALIALLLTMIASHPCQASSDPASTIDSVFALGQYEQVELLTLRLQKDMPSLPAGQRASINLTTGHALIMLGRESEAREYYRRALDADPTTHLDPIRISPKFRSVFDDVKATYRSHLRTQQPTMLVGPEPAALLLNLALPGSGQWMEGRKLRGAVVLTAQLATAGYVVWQADRLHRSSETYLHETRRDRVQSDYDAYDRDSRRMWVAGLSAAAVYLAAQADLAFLKHVVTSSSQARGSLRGVSIDGGVGLAWVQKW